MDRSALVLYLENIRDLEVIKARLEVIRSIERNKYQADINNHPTTAVVTKQHDIKMDVIILTARIIGLLFFCWLFMKGWWYAREFMRLNDHFGIVSRFFLAILCTFPVWLLQLCAVVWCLCGIYIDYSELTDTIERNKDIVKRNQDNEIIAKKNISYVNKRKEEWGKLDNYYKDETVKVNLLLAKFYNMNIIPKPYRDTTLDENRALATACYLYDYMSSSQESFQMALISNQIEDGIKRIEAKLDVIIGCLETIIWQQKVMREENRENVQRQKDQNNRMIDSLKRLESRAENIEEYSRLSANYNEAQAFISMAYYLNHR